MDENVWPASRETADDQVWLRQQRMSTMIQGHLTRRAARQPTWRRDSGANVA